MGYKPQVEGLDFKGERRSSSTLVGKEKKTCTDGNQLIDLVVGRGRVPTFDGTLLSEVLYEGRRQNRVVGEV